MSKVRPRSARLWPLACSAAVLWLIWATSVHLPRTFRVTDQLYFSIQRGCAGVWLWSPAERPSLGIRDNVSLGVPGGELANVPFAWCDAWGFGIGGPLWIPALILTAFAARRYAVTTVRDAPPATRRARRWAVVAITGFGAALLGLLVSGRHQVQRVATAGTVRVTLENGSLVFGKAEVTPPLNVNFTTGFVLPGTPAPPDPPNWNPFWIDLLPDFDGSSPQWRFALPLWPLIFLLGWLAWRIARKARFQGIGLCRNCGYSLAGLNADSACPECGTVARTVSS